MQPLLVYNVVGNVTGTDALSHLEMNGARIQGTPSLSEVSNGANRRPRKMIIADSSMSISSMSKVKWHQNKKVKRTFPKEERQEKALNYVTAPLNVASPSVPT